MQERAIVVRHVACVEGVRLDDIEVVHIPRVDFAVVQNHVIAAIRSEVLVPHAESVGDLVRGQTHLSQTRGRINR